MPDNTPNSLLSPIGVVEIAQLDTNRGGEALLSPSESKPKKKKDKKAADNSDSTQPLFGTIDLSDTSEGSSELQSKDVAAADETDGDSGTALLVFENVPQRVGEESAETVQADGGEIEAQALGGLQYANYSSFVLGFVLSGFMAVILFKKAVSFSAERLMSAAHIFALGCGIFVLHGFFNTYLYSTYLSGSRESLPLTFSFAVWVVIAPLASIVLNKAINAASAPKNESSAAINATLSVFGAIGAMLAVLDGLSQNLALGFALGGVGLSIFSSIRSFLAYSQAKTSHSELREASMQTLVVSLAGFPVLAAALAPITLSGLSGGITQLILNLFGVAFVALSAFYLLQSGKMQLSVAQSEEKPQEDVASNAEATLPFPQNAVADEEPSIASVAHGKMPPKPRFVPAAAGDKLSAADSPAATLPKPPAPVPIGKKAPGKKQYASSIETPAPVAPNAPDRIKAPIKPKKRF